MGVENGRDKDGEDKKGDKFSAKIIRVFAIIIAIIETPEEGRSDGNFDMFPSRLIYCGEKTDGAMLAGKVIKEMSEGAGSRNDDNAEPHDKSVVHESIIA